MEKIIKEGKDKELLIEEICNEYNVTTNDIYYNYYMKKSGIFSKNTIVIECILKANLISWIKEFLKDLMSNMGIDASFEVYQKENSTIIKIFSSNNSIIIGKEGRNLKALEYYLKQVINNKYSIKPYILLDVEDYREKQEKRLIQLAKKLAKEVNNTKIEVKLEDMNSYERRIIHNALTGFKGIITESEGEEPNRHIVIKPQ